MPAGERDLWVDRRGSSPGGQRLCDERADGCLLGITDDGHQPKVITYGVVFGEHAQARGAHREESGRIGKPDARN
jgi:hypothetical protein